MADYYHVGSREKLELVQIALDQSLGLRDALGNPTPPEQRQQMVHVPGRGYVPAFSIGAYNCVDQPSAHYPIIEGDDGTAAMVVPLEVSKVVDVLGKTVRGTAVPSPKDLVRVTGVKDHSKLPDGVMRVLDKKALAGIDVDPASVDDPSALDVDTRLKLAALVGDAGVSRIKAALASNKADNDQRALEAVVGIGSVKKGNAKR